MAAVEPGITTPDTGPRVMLRVALPITTSAMLIPTVPPIWNGTSSGLRPTPVLVRAACDQSINTPSVAEVRFIWKLRRVAMIFTASTPCSWALPSSAFSPTYLRNVAPEPVVKTPRFIAPLSTLNPMASASLLAGRVTVPKSAPAATFRRPPVPTYSRAPVILRDSKSPVMTAPEVPIDGSITVESVLRVISTVALP